MKLQEGEILTLNSTRYHIQEKWGRGAVSDVYLALLDGDPQAQVVLRLVRDDESDDLLKIAAMEHEAEVLATLNQAEDSGWARLPDAKARFRRAQETVQERRVVAMLDHGDATPGQPCVVQEIAPPAFERIDVQGPAGERVVLAIAQCVVDVIALAHRNGFSLKDFEPGTKGDRFRVQWLSEDHQEFTFKMIDWNITGGPDLMAQDLFYFGGHLYYILTGNPVPLDKEGRPPANLGTGDPVWANLTEGSRQLVRKLLHRDPQRRYQQVELLSADLAWWRDILAQIDASSVFPRLDGRLWQASPAGRYDRVVAIADLALRLDPPSGLRQSFEQSLNEARLELDKENWQPIAQAQVTLGTRAYEKADREFGQQIKVLPPESEASRLARIYQLLAKVGHQLRQHYQGHDERRSEEWQALEIQAIPALVQRRWPDALSALNDVVRLRPEAKSWKAVQDLENWVAGGVRYARDVPAAFQEIPNPVNPLDDKWLDEEERRIKMHQKAEKLLEEIQSGASYESEFKERLEIESVQLEQRRKFYRLYKDAVPPTQQGEEALEAARKADKDRNYPVVIEQSQKARQDLSEALEKFQNILGEDANQRRAQFFARRVEKWLEEAVRLDQQATTLRQVKPLLDAGQYDAALAQLQEVKAVLSGRGDAREYLVEAETGARLMGQVRTRLQTAQTYLNKGDFAQALEQLQNFGNWDGSPLMDLPGGQSLPAKIGGLPFRLLPDLRNQANDLQQQIDTTQEIDRNVQRALEAENFSEVVALCERLKERYPLPSVLQDTLRSAQVKLLTYGEADKLLASVSDIETLRRLENILREDESAKAQALLAQAAGKLIDNETATFADLRESLRLLRDNDSDLVPDLRRRAATKWLTLTRSLVGAGIDPVIERLQEGQEEPQFDALKGEFVNQLSLSKRAGAVVQSLTPESPRLPDWLGFEQSRESNLERLAEHLAALSAPGSWYQQLARDWQTLLTGTYLAQFVQDRESAFKGSSQQGHFKEALEGLQQLRDSIPVALRPQALQEDENPFWQALTNRLGADKELDGIRTWLSEDAAATFQSAYLQAQTVVLPNHSDVPVSDLAQVLDNLERAAEIEKILAYDPVADLEPEAGKRNYAQLIQACREQEAAVRKGLDLPRIENLGRQLGETGKKTVAELRQELGKAVANQLSHPGSPVQRLLDLYHQARWLQSLSMVSSPYPEMVRAQELPRKILGQALSMLASLENLNLLPGANGSGPEAKDQESAAQGLELLLHQAETLSNQLAYYPAEKLPTLPENVSLVETGGDWQLPSGPLNALNTGISRLKELLRQARALEVQDMPEPVSAPAAVPVDDAGDADVDAEEAASSELELPDITVTGPAYQSQQVTAVQALAKDVVAVIKSLLDLWPAFEFPYASDCALSYLGAEAGTCAEVAGHLVSAHRLAEGDRQAMQGLSLLSQNIENPELMEKLDNSSLEWLAQLRLALKVNAAALRRELITQLGGQVSDILALPDAVEQLQQQMLVVPKTRGLADAAYQAIRQGVALRAKQAENPDFEMLNLWQIVMLATEPFKRAGAPAPDEPPDKKARGRDKAKPRVRHKDTPPPGPVADTSPANPFAESPAVEASAAKPSTTNPKPALRSAPPRPGMRSSRKEEK